MKHYKVKPFKTHEEALEFLHKKGYSEADMHVINQLFELGHFQFKRYHIIMDPFGRFEQGEGFSLPEKIVIGTGMAFVFACVIAVAVAALWAADKINTMP